MWRMCMSILVSGWILTTPALWAHRWEQAVLAVLVGLLGLLVSPATTLWPRLRVVAFALGALRALSAFALAASEENGRGHLVITAPTGGSAGVMPALVYALIEERKVDRQKIRNGMLTAAAVGYLCKHHATLSAAEGGCPTRTAPRRCWRSIA